MITATHKGKYYDVEYSIINVSELEGELRIDAEYYDPKYVEILSKIHSKNNDLFWKFIIKFEAGKNLSQCKTGIPYIRTQNVRQIMIEKEGLSYVKTDKNKLKLLKKGDILFVRVGVGVGDCSVVNEEFENTTFSDNVIRIRLKEVNPFFITVFLNTKIGREYFSHVFKGTARLLISKENFQNLKIPIPSDTFQKFIEKLVLKAYEERKKAEQFYRQAEKILLEELGLEDWKPKAKKIKIGGQEFEEEENISIRMLSDVVKADRMDAEYWEPKYDEIGELIKDYRFGFKYIRDVLIDDIKNGTTPKSLLKFYDKTKYPFVRIDAFGSYLNIKENNLYSIDKTTLQKLSYCNVEKDDVLVSMTGTIGESVIYTLNEEGAINQNIVRLRVNSNYINPETLALFIKSIGKYLLNKLQTGNVQPYVNTINFSKLIVPLINPQTQQKISQLIQQSFKARENSKKLLEIAKRTVEIYIEKDEEEGLNYARNKLNELNIEIS